MSPPAIFVGIGRCSTQRWQAPACRASPGALSLVGFAGGGGEPYLLALLDGGRAPLGTDEATSIRLGVLVERETFDPRSPLRARVMAGGRIASFQLTPPALANSSNMSRGVPNHDGQWAAMLLGTSPRLAAAPLLWSTRRF